MIFRKIQSCSNGQNGSFWVLQNDQNWFHVISEGHKNPNCIFPIKLLQSVSTSKLALIWYYLCSRWCPLWNVLLTDQKSVYVSGWMKNQLLENCFHRQTFWLCHLQKGNKKRGQTLGPKKKRIEKCRMSDNCTFLNWIWKIAPFLRFLCVSWFWRPLLRQCTIWRTKFVLTNVKKKAGAFHPRSIYVQTAKVSIPNAEEFYWILPFWRLISCIRKCNRHSICDCWFKIWCYLWLFLVHPLLWLSIFLTNFLFLVQLAFAIKGTKIHSFQ